MRYFGENCPYCGLEFKEGDDVVVCPDCATPHHRACWFAHGDCANADKHAEGFVWKKAPAPEQETQAQPEAQAEKQDSKSLDIVCPDCGKVNPNGTLRCPDCGALLVPFAPLGGEPPIAQFRPEFNPNEEIGEIKSGDIALFCRVSGARYLKAFRKQAQGKKLGFNWGALIFAPYWFFYRKLYSVGSIFLALFVATSLWLMPGANNFYEAYESLQYEAAAVMEEQGEEAAYAVIEERMPEIQAAMKPLYVPMAIQFLLHLVCALIADRLYYQKAKKDILQVRSEKTDERAVQLELFKKGGTSFVWGAGAYFINELVLYLASWIIYG